MRIAMAQFDFAVGAPRRNAERIAAIATEARNVHGARLCLFPELAISGYLAEDLFLRPGYVAECAAALADLVPKIRGIDILVGYPLEERDRLANAGAWIRDGRIIATYRKQTLPNYTVFDEKRYFDAGNDSLVVELDGVRFGVLICEDIWDDGPSRRAVRDGAEALLVLNASPFDPTNRVRRFALLRERAQQHRIPIAYVNTVGGQDDLVFDGASTAVGADGTLVGPAASFEDGIVCVDFDTGTRAFAPVGWRPAEPAALDLLYRALVRATRDYVGKNRFRGVLLGLSGGIDSALTLAIAVDALGAGAVHAVMMPSRYTSGLSIDEAAAQARMLGVELLTLPIDQPCAAFERVLAPAFAGRGPDITEENLQARARGVLLMALSNKLGHMVLTTGNKSELATGYATLYGDMSGGFAPLKDVYKTVVYALAHHRNAVSPAIPEAVIARAPSAELRPGQRDQDSLPPYDLLDRILERFIERDESAEVIAAAGMDREVVDRVVAMVLANEYKRRQSAPGPRVTTRAFGRDRRFPISVDTALRNQA